MSAKSTRNRRRRERERQERRENERILLALGRGPVTTSRSTATAWTNSPRCSRANPCPAPNALHSALYGECCYLRASDESGTR